MHKEIITYTDLDGHEVTEEYLFNLTKFEITQWGFGTNDPEGLAQHLRNIVKSDDIQNALVQIKSIVKQAVGKRSANGRFIEKSPEIINEFMGTEAFSEFVFSLLQHPEKMAKFIQDILPKSMIEEYQKQSDQTKSVDEYTDEELMGMSDSDFEEVAGRDPLKMDKRVFMIAYERKNNKKSA